MSSGENRDIDKWVIGNEAADAAAGAVADHQGDHKKTLDDEEKAVAQLWKVMKRISAIELDIRLKDEGVPMTAENVIAAAEAMTNEWCNADTERAKRRVDQLIDVNGHRLDTMPDSGSGWVRCHECGRVAHIASDKYWSKVSCNQNR